MLRTIAIADKKEFAANAFNCDCHVPHHQLRIDRQHPIPQPLQPLIPPRIRHPPLAVIPAIDLNHEPHLLRHEVRDVAPGDRHLTPKRNAELPRPKLAPQPLFRRRCPAPAQLVGPSSQDLPPRCRA